MTGLLTALGMFFSGVMSGFVVAVWYLFRNPEVLFEQHSKALERTGGLR